MEIPEVSNELRARFDIKTTDYETFRNGVEIGGYAQIRDGVLVACDKDAPGAVRLVEAIFANGGWFKVEQRLVGDR